MRQDTFERGVEHEAADANQEIAKISHGEYRVMAIFSAAFDAFPGKMEEEKIGQSIDDLGRVVGSIIFLE